METFISSIKTSVRNWWVYLFLGILLVLTGIFTISTPLSSFISLSFFLGALILVAGILEIAFALSNRKSEVGWGWSLAMGILDLIFGFILLTYPGVSMIALTFLFGFWIISIGVGLISYSTELNRLKVPGWGWITTGGILTVISGILLIFNPVASAITVVVWTGIAFIVAGAIYIALALRLKKVKTALHIQ